MIQKESPYLEDVNELIEQAKQMGLIDAQISSALPNGTKCNTLQDIQESHLNEGRIVSLKFEDIRGMNFLYLICTGLSLVAMMVEMAIKLLSKTGTVSVMNVEDMIEDIRLGKI